MLRHSYYHRTVRTMAVVTGLVLAFDSGALVPATRDMSDSAVRYAATVVGVVASVPETELNKLSAELRERSDELDRREREIDARALAGNTQSNRSTYVLAAILLVLLALIVTNYALDIARARQQSPQPQS